MSEESRDGLREALKRTAVALKESGVPFALAGGYAAWARGGPEPEHDVDFAIAEADAAAVADSLAERDLRVVQPPEDWLFKVYTDDAMVDILYRLSGSVVERETLERADELEVLSVRMPVLVGHRRGRRQAQRHGRARVRPRPAPGRGPVPARAGRLGPGPCRDR